VRLDRKLLLIAPAIVLLCVVAGVLYIAVQLNVLHSVSDTLNERADFIASVERGDKALDNRQAINLLRWSLDIEARRSAALTAARDSLLVLSAIAFVACGVLSIGIRKVPREHWPRISLGRSRTE
jgi:hypothetical protein